MMHPEQNNFFWKVQGARDTVDCLYCFFDWANVVDVDNRLTFVFCMATQGILYCYILVLSERNIHYTTYSSLWATTPVPVLF